MNGAPPSPTPWTLQGPAHVITGYSHGLRQPALLLTLQVDADQSGDRMHLGAIWAQEPAWVQATGQAPLPAAWRKRPDDALKAAEWLLHWTYQLQRCVGLPVFEKGILLDHASGSGHHPGPRLRLSLLVPTAHGQSRPALDAFQGTLALFNQGLREHSDANATANPPPSEAPLLSSLQSLRQRLQTAMPRAGAANTPRFLSAAHELGIPVIPLGFSTYQFGQGRLGRWLDSSFTDVTPNIAARIALDKAWAVARLRQAGIPVPVHHLATDAGMAERIAQHLGYPVVVKPADRDGGYGVAAGLDNPQEVRDAYERARALSTRVLVERHLPGRDYRLTVFNQRLLWAIERRPGGVTGDGVSTLSQLIEQTNADPRRGEGPHAPLKRLTWDAEAESLATKAGLTASSIPAAGRFIRLRRTANVATGGTPIQVNAVVHPDNADLAVRAAQALRLDLAGVDLLLPDIARTWRETGGAVCEVNAQPQLGVITAPHLYRQILGDLVTGNGRIPIIVVVGAPPGVQLVEQLATRLKESGGGTGWSDERGVAIERDRGREWLTAARTGSFAAAQMLLTHPGVDRLIWSLNDDEAARQGLPFDRCDLLILAGRHFDRTQANTETATPAPRDLILTASLASLLPACGGPIFTLAGTDPNIAQRPFAKPDRRLQAPMELEKLIQQVLAHWVRLPRALTRVNGGNQLRSYGDSLLNPSLTDSAAHPPQNPGSPRRSCS